MTLSSVKVCSRTNCDLPIRSRGLCGTHYEAHRSRMIAYGKWESQRVDAAPVRAHYEALLAAGMGRNQVARVLVPRQRRMPTPMPRWMRLWSTGASNGFSIASPRTTARDIGRGLGKGRP